MATGPYSACSNTEPLSSSRLKLEPKLNKNIKKKKPTTNSWARGSVKMVTVAATERKGCNPSSKASHPLICRVV